ncbi:MAG: transporter [Mariprofundaceae bacterium]|nr:transporter [Mariprofundaceae bacterium]
MKRLINFALLMGILMVFLPGNAQAFMGICCGKCGGNMPMNIPGGGIPETKEFRFKVTPTFMRMDGLRNRTSSVDPGSLLGMPAAGKFMAVPTSMDMSMLNIAAGYSFTDDFFAGVMGMYQINSMEMKFNAPMTTMTGAPGYQMESSGFADTMLMAKYRLFADDPLIPTSQASLFMGVSLPTGSISERNTTHPLTMRQTELLPYGMQLGSGTFDPMLGVTYQGSTSPWWWGLNGIFTGRFDNNNQGYRKGNRVNADAYLMYQTRYDTVLELQLNYEWEGSIHGEANEALSGASGHAMKGNPNSPYMTPSWNPNNYGGQNLFTTLGVQWQPVPMHIINAQVGLPLYRNINGPQLERDWRISLTWYVEFPTKGSVRYTGQTSDKPSSLGF